VLDRKGTNGAVLRFKNLEHNRPDIVFAGMALKRSPKNKKLTHTALLANGWRVV